MADEKPLLTFAEFHDALGGAIGIHSLRAFAKVDPPLIRFIRVGRKYLIPASEVDELPRRLAEGNT